MKIMRKVRLLVRSAAMTNAYNAYFSIIVANLVKNAPIAYSYPP
jgi:hypothetical protein